MQDLLRRYVMVRQSPITKLLLAVLLLFPVCPAHGKGQKSDPAHPRTQEDTLKGINEMSVLFFVQGIRDISGSTYRSDIESRLKAAGIKILLPTEDPVNYPCLFLTVKGEFIRAQSERLLGSIITYRLEVLQVIPQTIGSQTEYIRGSTWYSDGFAWGSSIGIAADLRKRYIGLVDQFVNEYKKINQSH